jgi:hypothetical protein
MWIANAFCSRWGHCCTHLFFAIALSKVHVRATMPFDSQNVLCLFFHSVEVPSLESWLSFHVYFRLSELSEWVQDDIIFAKLQCLPVIFCLRQPESFPMKCCLTQCEIWNLCFRNSRGICNKEC